MIESPIATDSITNKQATGKASIYHTCRSVLNALNFVPGFEIYLNNLLEGDNSLTLPNSNDPLTKLWHICKTGSSLCFLYNTLKPEQPIQTSTNTTATNKSKAYVYHFIIACRDQLHFAEDTLFTVTELFSNDTNGFVKVVNTVKRILDMLEENGAISVKSITESALTSESPKDMRDNVVFELLSTERKYVQDLEALQNYMKEVHSHELLSPDTMHYLFGNLNALVDFQRRFLIQIEDQAASPAKEQRFGSLFIQFEEAFSVYEPFCANFQIAQDLVIQESPKLQKLAHIMSPTYELPAMLIKPIQRVCKYPLLIQQLVKSTPEDWTFVEENRQGLEAIQRVTKKVNETKRIQENQLVVKDLKKRIVDDNAPNGLVLVESFGTLLLHDKFTLQRHDTDHSREMVVFLFDKVILICKEIKDVNKNSISITKKKRKEGSLIVRGKILLSRVEHVKGSSSQNGHYTLHISWMELEPQNILLKCRNDEQLRQWLGVIIEEKQSSNNLKVDLISAPQTPRMEVNNPLLSYDEDEEEDDYYYYEHEERTVEEEGDDVSTNNLIPTMRNRSYSYQYNHAPTTPITGSRKASLSSASSNNITRHFMNGIPGMTLPPLPRSPTTTTATTAPTTPQQHLNNNSDLYSPLSSNLSFPSSPPGSYPSSPTLSTTTAATSIRTSSHQNSNNNINPSGSLWQRRQQSNEFIDDIIEEEEIPILPDSGNNYQHTRNRSQSSPNISRPMPQQQKIPPPSPPAPTHTATPTATIESIATIPSPTTPTSSSSSGEITKVKVHYFGAIYVVVVPTDIEYEELQKRIESKIKLCGQEFETSLLGLKYEDEDGDLITISSNEDVQMGFENKGPNNAVNLYVTS